MKKTLHPKIIAFDMDGTLLNEKKKICPKTFRYLKKLSKQGHHIVIASGRPSRSIIKYYNSLKLNTPMVCYNGAYVFSPKDPNFKPIEFEFPKEAIIELLSKIKPHIFNVMCETDKEIWVDKEDKYLDKFFWYDNMEVHVGSLDKIIDKNPMTCIVQTPFEYRDSTEVEEALSSYDKIGVRFWNGSPYFELFYKSTSKGNALKHICEYYKQPASDLIVFGDSNNDIEMFKEAGVSVLMQNAQDDLRQYADIITEKDNNNDGIYYTLKKLIKD